MPRHQQAIPDSCSIQNGKVAEAEGAGTKLGSRTVRAGAAAQAKQDTSTF
jgi:hypothetical protein